MRYQALVQTTLCIIMLLSFSLPTFGAGTSSPPLVSQDTSAQQRRNERAIKLFEDGNKLLKSERYDQATRKFVSAVRAWPEFAEAHSNLGYSYRKQKKYDKAIASYLKAIELDPELAEAREYLAEAYGELAADYRRKAHEELKVLKELDPEEAREVEKFLQNLDL